MQDIAEITDGLVGSVLDQVREWSGLGRSPESDLDKAAQKESDSKAALRPRVDRGGHIVVASVADQQQPTVRNLVGTTTHWVYDANV